MRRSLLRSWWVVGALYAGDVRAQEREPDGPPTHAQEPALPPPAPPPSLAPGPEPVYESVVRAPPPPERVPATPGLRSLLGEEAARVPGTLGDPLRAVQSLPGVARPGLVAGDLVVRGSSPWDTAVLVDGHPIPHLYHFLQGPAVLNAAFLDRVDFRPGGWGVSNGRKTGGLIEAETRAPDPNETRFEFDLDPIDSGILYAGPSGSHSSFGFALRRSVLGDLLPFFTGESAVPVYYDLQARQDFRITSDDDASVMLLGVQDRVEFPVPAEVSTVAGPGGSALRDETLFGRVIGRVRHRGKAFTWSLSPAFGIDHIAVQTGGQDLDYRVRTLRVRSDVEVPATERLVLRAGVDAEHAHYDFNYRLPAPDPFVGEFPAPTRAAYVVENAGREAIVALGVYGEVEQRLGPLTSVVGVRADHYRSPGGHTHGTLDARARLAVKTFDWLTLTGSVGSYHQPPQPRDLSGDLGNPSLAPERALQTTVGAVLDVGARTTLEVEAFENRFADQIVGSGAAVERGDEVVWENLRNGGSGSSRGVELLLRRPLTEKVSGWIAYTYSEAERRTCDTCEPFAFFLDQPHLLHVVVSWEFADRWLAGAKWSYASGSPTYRVAGATFDADTDRYSPDVQGYGEVRMPAFHQLDVRLERSFRVWGGVLRAYLEVLNVYYRKNAELQVWSYDYRRRGFFSGIPIVPAVGVGGAF